MPDDRSKPTRPPARAPREKDSPPGQYRASGILPETIAQVALRAPKATVRSDPHEEVMRAIAATEGKMLTEISDLREAEETRQAERQKIFEAELRKELHQIVLREVRSIPPPPPTGKRFDWSHLQYVAAFVVALTGLIALILGAQKPSSEAQKRFDAIDEAEAKTAKKLEEHVTSDKAQRETDRAQDYKYALDVRSWVTDVLERAASVKIDDPPGTPKRDQLGFYPAPRIDAHRVTDTHIVQPRDPYPVPPPP